MSCCMHFTNLTYPQTMGTLFPLPTVALRTGEASYLAPSARTDRLAEPDRTRGTARQSRKAPTTPACCFEVPIFRQLVLLVDACIYSENGVRPVRQESATTLPFHPKANRHCPGSG